MGKLRGAVLLAFCVIFLFLVAFLVNVDIESTPTPEVNQEALAEVHEYSQNSNVSAAYLIYHLQCIGYTYEESKLAVSIAGIDWEKEATDFAIWTLECEPQIDYENMKDRLEYAGFTQSEITLALNLIFGRG